MAELDAHISQLLFDYDCVIVPQLGGFVTNYKAATIDREKGIARPPSKDLSFNKNLVRSDGLLEQSVSDENGWTFREASDFIRREVEKYWESLNQGEKVKFEKVGILYFDEEKKLHFEPSREVNFLKSSFGFERFSLPPLPKKEAPTEVPVREIASQEIQAERKVSRNGGIYWVAAATILPFIALSTYIGLRTDFKSPTEISVAEILPGFSKTNEVPEYNERKDKTFDLSLNQESSNFPKKGAFQYSFETDRFDKGGVWMRLDYLTKPEVSTSSKLNDQYKYHIITGCFSEKANAEKHVNRLRAKGYDALILDHHKGLYRVRVEGFANYQKALAKLRTFRDSGTFSNAWMLKKPQAS